MSLYLPPDIEQSVRAFDANCGPIAFAAALNRPVVEWLKHCGPGWKYGTSGKRMQAALASAGVYHLAHREQWVGIGLNWIQLKGPWTRPSAFWARRYENSHWVAAAIPEDRSFVFDPLTCEWKERTEWEATTLREWMDETPEADGWQVRLGIDVILDRSAAK